MAKYRVPLITYAHAIIDVEADTLEEAIEEAFEIAPGLCAQCSGWGQPYGLELDDWDTNEDNEPHEIFAGENDE